MVVESNLKKASFYFLALAFSLPLISSVYSSNLFTDPFNLPQYTFSMIGGGITLLIGGLYRFNKNSVIRFNHIDVILAAFVLYLIANSTVANGIVFNDMQSITWLLYYLIYLVYKPWFEVSSFVEILFVIILLLLIYQVIYGYLELLNLIPKLQNNFRIGGAFGNPGPYANFIVGLFPVAVFMYLGVNKKRTKHLALLSIILTLGLIPFTQARTAWLAVVLFVFLLISSHQKIYRLIVKRLKRPLFLVLGVVVIITISVFVVKGLLSFKADSANGRLFIWEVSLKAIKDRPIFGYGQSAFTAKHNLLQANYFAHNPNDTKNAFLADCVKFAFNEFIQITFELGIVGLFIFMLIIYFSFKSVFRDWRKGRINNIQKIGLGILLMILSTSMFSYPLRMSSNLFLLFVSILLISSNENSAIVKWPHRYKINELFCVIVIIVSIVWLGISINRLKAEKLWKKAFVELHTGNKSKAFKMYESVECAMLYNPYFAYNYGAELAIAKKADESIAVLKQVEENVCDADYYIYLGINFENKGQLSKAIKCYEYASNIMPIKYIPKYKQVILYNEIGKKDIALKIANQVLQMPIKVNSEYVQHIRNEMQIYVNEN